MIPWHNSRRRSIKNSSGPRHASETAKKSPVPRLKKGDSYIFISYSHKDYKQVYADLADLYENGIPFWYDRGLPAGKNWDDVVWEKMNDPRCCGVIFFLSESLFLSHSIQTEIRIACGEDGTSDIPRQPLTYFCVNLTELSPSNLLDKVFADKRFTDVEDRMAAKGAWSATLIKAFPDKATYLPFSDKMHRQDLVEQIGIRFGLSPNENPYDFGSAKFVSGSGTIDFENGSRYTGQFRDNLFDGEGTLHYRSGVFYEGTWSRGKRYGQGALISPDGNMYEGQWKDDKPHGQGRFQWSTGKVYDGQWKNGVLHGHGRFQWPDGTMYEGQWKDNTRHGQGKMTFPGGAVYEGQWKDDKRHGQGSMTYPNGDIYDGDWKNGEACGQGSYTRKSDGHRYVGGWGKNGSCGRGTYYYPDGASRTGTWDGETLLKGQGVIRYEDGSWYDGEIRNNLRHGQGVLTQADGTVLSGQFREDEFIG